MTNEQKQTYLANPNICPYCESSNIVAGDTDHADATMFQNVMCEDCGKEWTDTYTITDVTPMD